MKKLAILSAFMVFGFISVNAQQASNNNKPAIITPTEVQDVTNDKQPANDSKKDSKHCSDKKETKGCGDAKAGEKKSCCANKKAEAKKEDN
ncbi:MAG: hypothetical protein ACK4K9_07715 [Bacteroidia bacterium]